MLLGDLHERHAVPGAELHLREAGLHLDLLAEDLGEDLRGLEGAAHRGRDHRVDLLGQRRQPLGGGPDLVAALVGQPAGWSWPGRRRTASRPCAAVTPWRTRITVVGGPPGGDQPRSGLAASAPRALELLDQRLGASSADALAGHRHPARRPSSASLASRSACSFWSRGTQVYVVPVGASRLGLRRQRPHVGVLDLPAPGHLLDHELGVHPDLDVGVRGELLRPAGGRRSARSTPRRCWSRRPIVAPSSAITSPVSASLSTAPYAAGPGLPREPPSASITTDLCSATVTDPTLGRADQDPLALLAADHLVARAPAGSRPARRRRW